MSSKDEQLTRAMEEFSSKGYTIIEEVFTPEDCDRMVKRGLEFTVKYMPKKEQRVFFSTEDAKRRFHKSEYFLQSNHNIHCFFEENVLDENGELTVPPSLAFNKVGHAIHLLDNVYRFYTYSDRVKAIARLLGLQEPAVVQSMLIYKNARIGGEVPGEFVFRNNNKAQGQTLRVADVDLSVSCFSHGQLHVTLFRTMSMQEDLSPSKSQHRFFYDYNTSFTHFVRSKVKNVCYVWQDHALTPPSNCDTQVTPHQDRTYLYTEPIAPIGFWVALEDATETNGCLWAIPGSHATGVRRRLTRNPDPNAEEVLIYDGPAPTYDQQDFKALPVKKGTIILLHGDVVHQSSHNQSDRSRLAYTFHIIEKCNNQYSSGNWLREGPNAPFLNLYNVDPGSLED